MPRRYQGSFMSGTYRPFLTPNAPTAVTASAGSAQATVSFTAPANTGGAPITSYTVISSAGHIATGTSSPITVIGLTNGTAYTFTVYAENTYGPGQRSIPSNSVSPIAAIIATLYAWGGGGGGGWNYGSGGTGGAGGAATGTIDLVTRTSGTIVIGGGGQAIRNDVYSQTRPTGGGGLAGAYGYGGQGGGYTGIFSGTPSQANAWLIAGGGGGGGWSGSNYQGGGGGGTNGQAGSPVTRNGGGGTQTAGGSNSTGTGTSEVGQPLRGGDVLYAEYGGGGGGGGYWGGGGAAETGGGGGSGYINTSVVSSGVLTAASGSTPGDSSNPLRGSYAVPGSGTGNGTQGVFIMRYSDSAPALSSTTGTVSVTVSGGFRTYTWTTAGTYTL